jgi:superfamily II DNA or RNA helicase
MSKAILSNRIYLNCERGSELDHKLMESLMYELSQEPISPYPLIINNTVRVSDTVISIPSGRLDLIPEEYEVVDRRVDEYVELFPPKFIPRENQQEAIDFIQGNGLVNAKVGWGKTIAGLGLIYKFGQKALIITTTTIRDMWVNEIKKHMGFAPGVIGGGRFETEPAICVGNIQTVRNKVTELAPLFGTIICDEVHRCPAKTFTDTLNALRAKHKIGLSGTLERKDGLHCVLPDYFGHDVFIARVENTIDPDVHLWETGIPLSANEFIPWANKITELINNPNYRQQILQLASSYAEMGHKVLVLCDRTDLLEWGHEETKDYSLIVTGKVKGVENRQYILDAIGDIDSEASILWGTQSIFSEGVSVNALSCVILATPINNEPLLEQICGRVMRKAEGKLDPIVCDVGLEGNTGKRHRNARKKFYINKGWSIKAQGSV